MDFFKRLYDFEKQGIQTIIFNMIKWFGFSDVTIETTYRGNVESGVWISITIKRDEQHWFVDGQRTDIVHRRLIEFLRKHLEK